MRRKRLPILNGFAGGHEALIVKLDGNPTDLRLYAKYLRSYIRGMTAAELETPFIASWTWYQWYLAYDWSLTRSDGRCFDRVEVES